MYNLSYGRKEPYRSTVKQTDEMNPKILPLDQLVRLINDKVLLYYLEQVSAFLRSTKKDLWFPKISPNLEAFLVRVIKDVHNMEVLMDQFNEESRVFAQQIVDCIKENQKVYHLDYSYESCKIDCNVLVYKKMFLTKQFESPSPRAIKKTNSSHPKASDPPDRRQDNFPSSSQHANSFQTHWLNVTLQFIKDSTRLNLECPEMSYNEANYVLSLIQKAKLDSSEPLFRELKDALKLYYTTHEFKTSLLYIAGNKVQLCVEKVPHQKKKDDEKGSLNASKSSETDSESKLTKAQKTLARKQRLVQSLDCTFINTALKMILDFIRNEAEASLLFSNANDEQCTFIQSACNMARDKRTYSMFAESSRGSLRSIADSLASNTLFDLSITSAKMQKDNQLRTVTLTKTPKKSLMSNRSNAPIEFKSVSTLEPTKGGITETTDKGTATDLPKAPTVPETKTEDTKPIAPEEIKKDDAKPEQDVLKVAINDTETNANIENARKIETIVNGVKDAKPNDAKPEANTNQVKLFGRKAKLVEAMSVPLESDIAIRMMRQMGWHGGPLGLRGEGITEPLMPALHLASGAGLGHIKETDKKKEKNMKEAIPYLELLREIHLLLSKSNTERVLKYNTPLLKKEKQFVKVILKSLSSRRPVECNDATKQLVDQIMVDLANAPDAQLDCRLSEDRKSLTLLKVIRSKPIPKMTGQKPEPPLEDHITAIPDPLTREWTSAVGKRYCSDLAAKGHKQLGHRVGLLGRILQFFKEDSYEASITFEYALTKKQINYLTQAVKEVNDGGKNCFNSSIEQAIVSDIRKLNKNLCLVHCVINKRKVYFRKTFKIAKNSAKQMCDIANNNNSAVDNNKCKDSVASEKKTEININVNIKEGIKADTIIDVHNNKDSVVSQNKNDLNINVNKTDLIKDVDTVKLDGVESKLERYNEKTVEELEKEFLNETSIMKKSLIQLEKEISLLQKGIKKCENDFENDSTSSSKRSRTTSENSAKLVKKKTKLDENITILKVSTQHDAIITTEKIKEFQTVISDKIDVSVDLPLIECNGVQNGALTYICYNDIGVKFIASVASEMNLKTTKCTELKDKGKVLIKMRLNTYVPINLKNLFNKIERFNVGLSTDLWSVNDVHAHSDFIVILLEVDDISLDYISESKFSLFAGIDKIRFSIDWN